MAQQLPNLRAQNFGSSLKILFVDNTDLVRGKRFTFLTEDVVALGTTLRVQSVAGMESLTTSSGRVLIVGEIGGERTELVRTSTASAEFPSQATKTAYLRDSLVFDHPQDTKVYIVDWDRIEFNYAASATGTKTTLAAYPVAVSVDMSETEFRDTTTSSDRLTGGPATAFYFARFNETVSSRNSAWSDPIWGSGFDDNMVGAIKQRALDSLGEQIDGKVITHEFLNASLWEARREYHSAAGKRPFRRKFNTDIGNALTGSARIELPTDVERPYTSENVYGVRIGANQNMTYQDKKAHDADWRSKPHSFLTTAYATADQDLYVNDTRDFSDSGSVTVEGITIAYSAKSVTGGTMRISTAGSAAASVGSDVWQNVTYGLPTRFTVWADPGGSAYVYFNCVIDSAYVNMNVYADYFRTLVSYDSDGDTLDEADYDMYVSYLMAKIKHRKNKGEGNITQDPDYIIYRAKMAAALAREFLATDIRFSPDLPYDSLLS